VVLGVDAPQMAAPARQHRGLGALSFLVGGSEVKPAVGSRDNLGVDLHLPLAGAMETLRLELRHDGAVVAPRIGMGIVFEQMCAHAGRAGGSADPDVAAKVSAARSPHARRIVEGRNFEPAHPDAAGKRRAERRENAAGELFVAESRSGRDWRRRVERVDRTESGRHCDRENAVTSF